MARVPKAQKEFKEKPILLVDISNMVYRQASKLRFLKRGDGRPTGGVFGTVRALLSWAKEYRVIAVFDGSPADRMNLLGGYKAGRTDTMVDSAPRGQEPSAHDGQTMAPVVFDENSEDILEEVGLPENTTTLKTLVREDLAYLMNYLPGFGIPVMFHPQQEADDMIGYAVLQHQLEGTKLPILVLSSDMDFDQLPSAKITSMKLKIPEGVTIPMANKDHYILEDSFFYFPEVPQDSMLRQFPHFLMLYRALLGDSSDKIKRISTKKALWKKDPSLGYLFDRMMIEMQKVLVQYKPDDTVLPPKWQGKFNTDTFCGFQILLQKHLDNTTDINPWDCFKAFLNDEQLAAVPLNIRLTRIPFDLTKSASETLIRVKTSDVVGAIPQNFLLEAYWKGETDVYTDTTLVKDLCMNFEMPSLVKGFESPFLATKGWNNLEAPADGVFEAFN